MAYFEFPHTRTYDGDLGYIIKKIIELTEKYDNFFEYNSIRFADPIQWNITTQYPAYMIVSDTATNASYISKKPVPSGIELTNNDYWEILGSLIIDPVARQDIVNLSASTAIRFDVVNTKITNINSSITDINGNIDDINNSIENVSNDIEDLTGSLADEKQNRENADALINTRIDNIVALEPGSTTGDAELQDIRLAITGNTYPVAGDAVRGQASMLSDIINGATENSYNLFDPYSVLIGTNATGSTGHPNRAISGAMNVGVNGAKIVVSGIPAGVSFDIERYSGSAYNTRTGIDAQGFIDSTGTYTYSYSDPYIRFLFKKSDNSNFTPSDFDGLSIFAVAGLNIPDQLPNRIAKDPIARDNINGVVDAVSPFGIVPFDGYINASISSGTHPYASSYLLSDYVAIDEYSILKCTSGRTNEYVLGVSVYNSDKEWIKTSSYTALYDKDGYKIGANASYVRFIIRKSNSDLSEFYSIYPSESINLAQYVTHFKESGKKLKVLTYNVGRWDYGVGHGIPSAIYNEKLTNYRRFFGEHDPDIIGLQECDRLIDEAQSIDFRTVLTDHWDYYSYVTGSWEALLSKYNISGGHTGQLTTGRYYCDSYVDIEGTIMYLLAVHLTPGHNAEDIATRSTEMTEVLSLVAGKEHFIIFGDFNPEPTEYNSLFALATDAGYNIANAGFFGDYWTVTSNSDDFNHYDNPSGTVYYVDNIITSSNINIDYAVALNVYNKLSSDHIPVYAEVTIKE